jgi:plasmid stabilization system protein ParE
MTIRYTPRARSDLQEIIRFITKENPAAARRLRAAILDAIQLVGRHPYLGIKNARAPALRSKLVTRYPYRVHYFVQGADVWIVHIRHSARRPWEEA